MNRGSGRRRAHDAARRAQVPEPPHRQADLGHHQAAGPRFGSYCAGAPSRLGRAKRLDGLRYFRWRHQYLRRRAWRYFRRMGQSSPERYVAAVSRGLVRYTDQDVSDGLALIDNWGLTRALFRRSKVVAANPAAGCSRRAAGWRSYQRTIYERLWSRRPGHGRVADGFAMPAGQAMGHPDGAPIRLGPGGGRARRSVPVVVHVRIRMP